MTRINLLIVTFLLIVTPKSFGQDPIGRADDLRVIKTSVPFLTIAPDSRGAGLGDAGVSSSPDLSSQHWNSSKYMFMKERSGVGISYTPWLKNLGVTDLNLLYLSGFYKFDELQAVSGGLRYFNLGEIKEIDANSNPTGNTIRPHEFAIDAAYNRKFSDKFSGGLVFRFIYSNIAAGTSDLQEGARYEPGTSYAADLNGYYQSPVQLGTYDGEMAFGFNISNIGSKMSYSESEEKQFIPTNLRLGGRLTVDLDEYNSLSATLDISKLLVPTPPLKQGDTLIIAGKDDNVGVMQGMIQSFYDAPGGAKEEFREIMWSVGAEYWYRKQFAIRTGYFHEHETKGNRKYFNVGVGLKMNVFSLDFSYLFPATGGRNNPLANTMRFTLGFVFE